MSKKNNSKSKYTAISLFSGAMGLDLGVEKTGRFKFLACLEKEPIFCETIRLNQKNGRLPSDLKIYEGDINDIDPLEVLSDLDLSPGEVDLIIGGPPCQAFSTAGKRQSTQDPRGTLVWQFLRFVSCIKPKFFLMENVRGLISAALLHRPIAERPDKGGSPLQENEMPGSVIRLFTEDLSKIEGASYRLDGFEVNAVNYGAPQIRERVLFIGNRFNAEVHFPDPTHGSVDRNNSQIKLFDDDSKLLPWRTLRDAIGDIQESDPEIMDFSPRKKEYLSKIPEGSNWRSLSEEDQKESMKKAYFAKGGRSGWWRRLSYDLPCPTLVTMPNHAGTSLCHPKEVRALTLKEYARIQEFPDDWVFAGTTSQKYAQVGNAVPVRLGEVAGEVLVRYLDELEKRNWIQYNNSKLNYKLTYIQSHVRTRQWFKNGKTYVWDNEGENSDNCYSLPKTKRKTKAIIN
ncbi:MAG: DNA cytosine methyltransferase [Methanomicrobiales archaeon]|nr:DNA cytosine methyltransferase [Methanomicrobiales archaeon]